MLSRFLYHLRHGTLIRAISRKLGLVSKQQAMPNHYHGDVAKDYLRKRLKQKLWHEEQNAMKEMLTTIPDGGTVLDVAIGTGRFVDMYLEKKMSVYGIDISEDMLKAARQALGKSYDMCLFYKGSADSLPYENNSFDLVVCFRFFGLISLEMGHRVLSEIHRVSRGLTIIRVPVRKETAPPLSAISDSDAIQGRLDEQALNRMFEGHGFMVQDRRWIDDKNDDVFIALFVLKKTSTGVASDI